MQFTKLCEKDNVIYPREAIGKLGVSARGIILAVRSLPPPHCHKGNPKSRSWPAILDQAGHSLGVHQSALHLESTNYLDISLNT